MYNNTIRSDDPGAIEKLREKLTSLEESQALMKDINTYYRKNGTCVGAMGISEEQAHKLDEKVAGGYSWEKQPFPSYSLTNNSSEIRRIKKRIDELTKNTEVGFVGWGFNGGEVVVNNDLCRLQVLFDEKPDEQERSVLKLNGFKWAPSEGAWQRQLNTNAIYAASRVDFIKPKSGENPIKLQPKVPQKDIPER